MTNNIYIALTGDIRSSSRVEDRRDLAKRLLELCEQLNKHFAPFILTPFKVVSGDGIQGLLKLDTNLMKLSFYIRAVIHPYFMRLGFGIGGIDTDMEADVSKMDGECFRNSAQAVEIVKKKDDWVYLEPQEINYNHLLSSIFSIYETFLEKFTSRQNTIINQYISILIEKGKVTHKQVADIMGIPRSNVSKALNKVNWRSIYEIMNAIPTIRDFIEVWEKYQNES